MRILTIAAVSVLLLANCGADSDDSSQGVTNDSDAGNDRPRRGGGDDDEADDDAAEDDDSASDDDSAGDDDAPVRPRPATEPEPTAEPEPEPTSEPEPTPEPEPEPAVTPVEDGCMPISYSANLTSCELREQCANAYRYSYCGESAEGEWTCSCSDGSISHELRVTANSAPCEMVSDACSTIAVSGFTGDANCELESQTATTSYCETQTRCSQAVAVNPDIEVLASGYQYTTCYDDGAGGLSCSCSGLSGSRSFTISDATPQTACSPASAICSGQDVVEGAPVCTVTYEYAGSGYCQRQQTCTTTVAADGVEANLTDTHAASCSETAEQETSCSCANSSRSYSFELGIAADTPTTCLTAMAVCESDDAPVPVGAAQCTLVSQSASTSYCDASTQCVQGATVNGVEIGLYGNLYTYCQPNGDNWLCQCSSGVGSASLDIVAEDSWGACEAATTQCPDLIPVQVGTGGTCIYPGTDVAVPCAQ